MLPDPRPYFAHLVDPRRATRNTLHKLEDILMIVFSATLSGIEDWVGMEEFGNQKQDGLKRFLDLTNGIPSHDTLSDVIGRLEPGAFAEAFLCWVKAAIPSLAGEQAPGSRKGIFGVTREPRFGGVLAFYDLGMQCWRKAERRPVFPEIPPVWLKNNSFNEW